MSIYFTDSGRASTSERTRAYPIMVALDIPKVRNMMENELFHIFLPNITFISNKRMECVNITFIDGKTFCSFAANTKFPDRSAREFHLPP